MGASSTRKTSPRDASVSAFLDAVPQAERREDAKRVAELMAELSGEPPVLWGASLIGFGQYAYKTKSSKTKTGSADQWMRIGFSPRAAHLVLYFTDGLERHAALLAKLGPHTIGKSCLYINRLRDIDWDTLKAIIDASLRAPR